MDRLLNMVQTIVAGIAEIKDRMSCIEAEGSLGQRRGQRPVADSPASRNTYWTSRTSTRHCVVCPRTERLTSRLTPIVSPR